MLIVAADGQPPSTEQVAAMMHGLQSVRDYERLHWILEAINAQDATTRAEWIQTLDNRVQQLLAASDRIAPPQTGASAEPLPLAIEEAEQPSDHMTGPAAQSPLGMPQAAAASKKRRSYDSVKWEINRLSLSQDSQANATQLQELSQHILAVDDPRQRSELYELLRERMGEQLEGGS
jgi:hypothetical protein